MTIRDLQVREKTGASIIAIYRKGTHIANPAPTTVLLPNDIVMLLGNEEERQRAKALLA
jgi:TrkA domain protein